MSTQHFDRSWFIERHKVFDIGDLNQIRKNLLSYRPQSAVFETGPGFLAVDGSETTFMMDLQFDLKLVNDQWLLNTDEAFAQHENSILALANDCSEPLHVRMRNICKVLAIPDGFPTVVMLGFSSVRFMESLPDINIKPNEPEVVLRVYKYVVKLHPNRQGATIEILKTALHEQTDISDLLNILKRKTTRAETPWQVGTISDLTDKEQFYQAVKKAKQHILDGDIYQIQLCRKMQSTATILPIELFDRLVSVNPSPYSYYLDLGEQHVISSSPELLLRCTNGVVQVRPIAGTMSKTSTQNNPLDQIPKEAAEHLMLVDLARNDLAQCAIAGGVKVTSFMSVEEYGPLQHLVSTIETPIRTHHDIWDVIVANFPAGTMTGAPKIRSIEIISDLEQSGRGLFTGCAGYITDAKNGVLALTIRTIIGNPGNYILQSAAGVVADSEAESEWAETGIKIQSFARAMGVHA